MLQRRGHDVIRHRAGRRIIKPKPNNWNRTTVSKAPSASDACEPFERRALLHIRLVGRHRRELGKERAATARIRYHKERLAASECRQLDLKRRPHALAASHVRRANILQLVRSIASTTEDAKREVLHARVIACSATAKCQPSAANNADLQPFLASWQFDRC